MKLFNDPNVVVSSLYTGVTEIPNLDFTTEKFLPLMKEVTPKTITAIIESAGYARLAIASHGIGIGDYVEVAGTANYNGYWTVTSKPNAGAIVINAPYVADESSAGMLSTRYLRWFPITENMLAVPFVYATCNAVPGSYTLKIYGGWNTGTLSTNTTLLKTVTMTESSGIRIFAPEDFLCLIPITGVLVALSISITSDGVNDTSQTAYCQIYDSSRSLDISTILGASPVSGDDIAAKILATPANLLGTDANGKVRTIGGKFAGM